jgi:hypothetical protein
VPDAKYDIQGTNLPFTQPGCLLDQVSITGRKFITGGLSFAINIKDLPLHLIHDSYIRKLQWINTRYVILWDQGNKRDWLINSISTLLHLVCTSLANNTMDDFSSTFLYNPHKMKEAAEYKPNSAITILIDNRNRILEIYPGKSKVTEKEEEDIITGS